jgi:hypothetical protein
MMVLPPVPDPTPPAKIAHVSVDYRLQLRDGLGRSWSCMYPARGKVWRICTWLPG